MVLAKKDLIEQNRRKIGLIWPQDQNYDLFDTSWRKLEPKKYFNLQYKNIDSDTWRMTHYCVDTWTFKKIKKIRKIKNKIKYFKKNFKKSRSVTWRSLFMVVNNLNSVNKKRSNWIKLMKIGTYSNTKTKLGFIWQNLTKIGRKRRVNQKDWNYLCQKIKHKKLNVNISVINKMRRKMLNELVYFK